MPHATATRAGIEPGSERRDRGPDESRARAGWTPGGAAPLLEESADRGIPQILLGLRFLALAVIAGSGALLPVESARLPQLMVCILAGAAIGIAQYAALRSRLKWPGVALILAQVAVWTWLVHISGDQRSPLFVGYLLEVALSGAAFSRRGCVLAAVSSLAAYVLHVSSDDRPLQPGTLATVGGFLAVGSVLTWLVIDVIERQRRRLHLYQGALRERAETIAEELRLLGDYLGGALIGIDGLGRVVSVNRACGPLLGIEAGGAIGRPWQEVLRADAEGSGAIAGTLCDAAPRRGVRTALQRRDGTTVAVEAELWVSPSPAGRRTYLLMGEIVAAAASADPLRRLGEASAIVAHQIKNSLHALQGLATELARERNGCAEREDADRLRQVVRGLATLSDDVLAMAGTSRPPQESVALEEVLSSAALLSRHAPGQVLVEDMDPELCVRAHRGQLVHAFFNLLDNACRVTPCGAHVRVRAARCQERILVEITDSGPGLPGALASCSAPVLSHHGAGLGLMAARRFIEANGGTLAFHPGTPAGTVCSVHFPQQPNPD